MVHRRAWVGSAGPWPTPQGVTSTLLALEQEWEWLWPLIHVVVLGPSQPMDPLQLLPAAPLSGAKGEPSWPPYQLGCLSASAGPGRAVVCLRVPASMAVLAERTCTCTRDTSPWVVLAGVSEDCCLAYHHRARPRLLMRAQGYQRQEVSGSCNLPAVM